MRKLALLFMLFIGLTGFGTNSSRTITGTVYDASDKLPLVGVTVRIEETGASASTDVKGHYQITITDEKQTLLVSFIGYQQQRIKVSGRSVIDVILKGRDAQLNEVVVVGYGVQRKQDITASVAQVGSSKAKTRANGKDYKTNAVTLTPSAVAGLNLQVVDDYGDQAQLTGIKSGEPSKIFNVKKRRTDIAFAPPAPENDESYKGMVENAFQNPIDNPLSTFSVDVDAASYTNIRRFINQGQLPPKDAVRIEEMINYFNYNLPGPKDNSPVAIHTELSTAPWNPQHRLLRIGLKAKTFVTDKLPASNLVFLIDVSGSMWQPNKLPLVQSSLKLLVDQLRPQDKVAIVVYAGAAGLVLPPTPGDHTTDIKDAIERLTAGGSTAGGAGIKLAYKVAKENFIKGGNNRVILATDGDFNVGASSDEDMQSLIENERKSGVYLSALGFGMGNYKDSKMETLADKGNGNYAYIDNITEARKTLVSEFGGTLFTVAKDVKLQLEFNPAKVQAYRLIGYENRMLNKEDFNNDLKDAGDMGAGHTVTALYEIIPIGVHDNFTNSVDPLKYQKPQKAIGTSISSDVVTIKFRYKEPDSDKSKLSQAVVMDEPVALNNTSADFRFAAAVAEFGMLLRDSDYKQHSKFEQAIEMARAAKGDDHEGYRAEFIKLAESARLMANSGLAAKE